MAYPIVSPPRTGDFRELEKWYQNVSGWINDPSIDAAAITSGTITGTYISDGAISTPKLAANAVTAAKVDSQAILARHIVVQGGNLVPNGTSELGMTYADSGNDFSCRHAKYDVTNSYAGDWCREWDYTSPTTNQWFSFHSDNPVQALEVFEGQEYGLEAYCKHTSGGGAGAFLLMLSWYTEDGTWISNSSVSVNTTASYVQWSVSGTAPATAAWMTPGTWGNTAGMYYIDNIECYRKSGTTMISSGAITTDLISANAITSAKIAANQITATHIGTNEIVANTANIADGVIANAKIANGTITYAKIASVDANTITVNTIGASQISVTNLAAIDSDMGAITAGSITSSGFALPSDSDSTAGSGWKIDTAGGIQAYSTGLSHVFGGCVVYTNGNYMASIGAELTATGLTKRYPQINGTNFTVDGQYHHYYYNGTSTSYEEICNIGLAPSGSDYYGMKITMKGAMTWGIVIGDPDSKMVIGVSSSSGRASATCFYGWTDGTGSATGGWFGSKYGYGVQAYMNSQNGTSPLVITPSYYSAAPTHAALKGSLWATSAGILYINTDGSTTWSKIGAQ